MNVNVGTDSEVFEQEEATPFNAAAVVLCVCTLPDVVPQPWLLSMVFDTEPPLSMSSMDVEVIDFIATHIAKHCDPFLDGEITSLEAERGRYWSVVPH